MIDDITKYILNEAQDNNKKLRWWNVPACKKIGNDINKIQDKLDKEAWKHGQGTPKWNQMAKQYDVLEKKFELCKKKCCS